MPKGYKREVPLTKEQEKIERAKVWKRYYLKNKEKLKQRNKERRENNKEYHIQYEKERYAKNPEFYKQKWLKYCRENRKKINAKRKYRYENEVDYKLRCILRSRFRQALSKKDKLSSIDFVGCSVSELKQHIEKQFKKGMNWNNWSQTGWHIDHIIPLFKFDLSEKTQVEKAFHYTNLQPLWAKENQSKNKS